MLSFTQYFKMRILLLLASFVFQTFEIIGNYKLVILIRRKVFRRNEMDFRMIMYLNRSIVFLLFFYSFNNVTYLCRRRHILVAQLR